MQKNLHEKVRADLEKKGELKSLKEKFDKKIKELIKDPNLPRNKPHQSPFPELETRHGQLCAALIKDFFDQFDMKMTLSVYLPESQIKNTDEAIESLANALQVNPTKKRPLLFEIIERAFAQEEEEDEELETSIEENINNESDESKGDQLFESGGSGYDQSTNSLALEKFDYIEPVRKVR